MGDETAPAPARQAVFLDRDGVLNRAPVRDGRPYSPASLAEVEIPPDVPEALRVLKAAGFALIGATNQPDVRRGIQRRDAVEKINAALVRDLGLDEMLVCYHDDRDRCACRKPEPGLLLEGAARHAVDLSESFMVGDRWRDIEAGRRAGCTTVLIGSGWGEMDRSAPPDHRVATLGEAARWIVAQRSVPGRKG